MQKQTYHEQLEHDPISMCIDSAGFTHNGLAIGYQNLGAEHMCLGQGQDSGPALLLTCCEGVS